MLRLLLFAAVALGGIGFIISQVFGFMFSLQGTKGKIRRDTNKLREELKAYLDKLVPLDSTELELLSLNQSDRTVSRGMNKVIKGAFTSIYHEPLVAYAYKEYSAEAKKAVLLILTHDREFIYNIDGNTTELSINGQVYGTINNKGQLLRDQQLLGELKVEDGLELSPFKAKDKLVARVKNPERVDTVNPRAFSILEPMNEEEEEIFLSLSMLYLIQSSNK